jgi:hypothetical protein
MGRLGRFLVMLAAPLLLCAAPPSAPVPGVRDATTTAAVRVTVETVAVDRRGTWSLGTDVADLLPGGTGVLKKSATLISRGESSEAREMVEMTVHLRATVKPDGGCALDIGTETRGVVTGAKSGGKSPQPDRTRATIALKPEQERLLDAYTSTATQGRLALKVRCDSPPAATGAVSESDLRFVDFLLSVARADGEKDPRPMKSDQLHAIVGREASSLFSFNVPLDPDASGANRYRREKLEVALTPLLVSGGRAQVALRVLGEMATVGADGPPIAHPIEHTDTLVIAPGEKREIDIDVRSSGGDEGWKRVRYRLALVGSF